jgi:alkaline phosphatase D
MDPFPLGVASFDPTGDSMVLWTWTSHGVDDVRWEIACDPAFDHIARQGASRPEDGIVCVEVDHLEPGTTYHYRFGTDEHLVTGTTRTLPAAAHRLRIGFASCSRRPGRGFDAYGRLADREPDLMVHLGDYIYERSDEAPHTCRTLDDYRTRYQQYRREPPLQRLHAGAPWITVWDDHEIADGSWRRGTSSDLDDPDGFAARRRAAQAAYDEYLPHRVDERGPTHLDRHLRVGDLVDLVVLDARNAGREEPVRPAGGPALVGGDDDRRILTEEQWDWLEECVADIPGWLVLGTQTQVAPLRLARLPDPRRPWRTLPLVNAGQWDGYPAERRRLGALLEPVADRTLIVSGDLHGRFWTAMTTPSGRRIAELTIPSVSSTPFADAVRKKVPFMPTGVLRRWLAWLNPHVESMELTGHGAAVVDVAADRLDIEVVDPAGVLTFRTSLTREPRTDQRRGRATPRKRTGRSSTSSA